MLRAVTSGFDFSFDGDRLELGFVLESGCYATSLLRELLEVSDVTQG
jgi:tRNA(Glu) U13 pseudouridine synthase TruD